MTSERKEDYLKTIDKIISEKGYAQVKDISRSLEVGPSSVTGMLKKLTDEGYINYEKYGGVTLTQKGKETADETKEKYRTIKEFLTALGVSETVAEDDACKMEHVIAPDTYTKFLMFCEFSITEKGTNQMENFKKYCETGKTEKCTCGPKIQKL
ncbi:HTH-type transcriptional regulator MntR [Methanosarcinaceae archaeon Ag5]|uniref:HTH-type transcriptional regulator MntR n=1 Tax=Methanolapillus africanus TaxID=3028297 RepID=A0AAE4MK33_9EURY|nr:HTH-type transcriptional regulator MntR [Methanosarcinaceae archaeon Ag5]